MTVIREWDNGHGSTLRLLHDGHDVVIEADFEGIDEGIRYEVPVEFRLSVDLIWSMFVAKIVAAVNDGPTVTLH